MGHRKIIALGFKSKKNLEEYLELYDCSRMVIPYILHTKEEILSLDRKEYGKEEMNDEEFYSWYTRCSTLDEDGNVISIDNPQGKFDYYDIIDKLETKYMKGLFFENNHISAVLTPSGWHEIDCRKPDYDMIVIKYCFKYLEMSSYIVDIHE